MFIKSTHIRYLLVSVFLFFSVTLDAQTTGIHIVPLRMEVVDDSVRIDLKISVTGIDIPTKQSLRLIPVLEYKSKHVVLPSVLLSGRQRARFDRRKELLHPVPNPIAPNHILVGIERDSSYVLNYSTSLPYASWMVHAGLRLRQISRDCCTEQLQSDDILIPDIALVSPCEVGQTFLRTATPASSPVLSTTVDTVLTMREADPSVRTLLPNPSVTIREIRITRFTSLEGMYHDYPINTPWAAEDWGEIIIIYTRTREA